MSNTPPVTAPAPQPINRGGPTSMPSMPMAANAYTFLNSPYNFQASMLGAGNPGMGMYGFSQQLPNSYMMQRFLPEVTRHAMTQYAQNGSQPFPYQYQSPWQMNGQQAQFNPAAYGQQQSQPPQGQPSQPTPNNPPLFNARQQFLQSLSPEQSALRGGANGNQDFRQSLTPQQMQLRDAVIAARQQTGPQSTPQPMPPATQSAPQSQSMLTQNPYARQGMPQGMPQQSQYRNYLQQLMPGFFNLGMGF